MTYLGVALDDFAGDLVGLESVLEFHAYGVDAVLNKVSSGVLVIPAAGKLDWSTFTSTGLDLSAAQAALNGTTLGALTSSVDLAIDGSVVLNVLSGVLVAKGDFTIALGQVQSALLPSGVSADADAMVLTLSNVGVFVGVGGALLDNNGGAATPTDYSDDTVVNGTLGFGATVGTLTLVSIKDRGALPLLATDDVTYLGVALDDFAGDLVGLESVLEFHAYGVDAVLNKVSSGVLVIPAAGKLDWSTFTSTGLDLSAAQAALNGTTLGALTSSVDLAIDGSVVLNVLSGVLVAKGDFTIALGQVQSALLPSGVSADADAMVLTLSNVGVFVGVGGALLDNNGGAATPTDYSDDTVVNGTLGFGATVGTLTLVSIKDRGALPLLATDDVTYLGVALDDFAGDLVGLESVLEFHAYGVDAVLNKVSSGVLVIPAAGKLDWSTFTSTGLDLSAAQAALNGTTLGALTSSVDLAIDGSVVLNVLSGVLVAKGDFTIALGQVQSALLPSGVSADADAMTLTLSNVGVFVGVGGALLDNNGGAATPTDYSDDTVVNGTLGFGATVTTLTLVSIKDRGALPLLATDDVTYLGVALDDFAGDLVGLESVLEFHAYGVDAVLNKVSSGVLVIPAAGKLDWSTFTSTGLDLSAAQAALNGTTLGALTASVDLAIDGGVALNVLSGVLVAKGDFTIALGQVQSALLPSGVSADADAMTLTLTNVGVFVGVGGALLDNNGGAATPTDYSDDTVVNGTLGFGATVTTLTLVSIKDRGALPLLATDDVTYLGVALDDFAGDLVGLESVLEFHAYGVDAVLNKVSSGVLVIPAAGKLDWSTFTSTGLDLSAAQAALNGTTLGALTSSVDLAIDGSVVLNVLSGVLVAKGDFTIALGQVQSALLPSGVSADADAMVLTLSNVGVFVGVGGALLDNNGGAATPTDYSDDTVVNGTLGFGATVGTLTLVSIKDRGALPLLATDDVTYLGVALDDFAGDLVGLESVLEFHAYGVDAVLNKVSSGVLVIPAAGKLDWSTFTSTGLDLSAAQAALNGTTLGALTSSVDLAIDGSVVLNVLSGVLVAKGDFTIALGQVQSALLPSGVSADADAMVLTLSNVGVFVGVGGALLDNNGGAATPTDYSDDTVVNGTLGFGATVGTLTLVSIKDRGALPLLATDDVTYLGVALDDFAGDLVGLESVLEFHAYGVDAVLNKVSSGVLVIPAAGKLDWSTFTSTGLDLSAAQAALNGTTLGALTSSVDLAIDGSVVLNVLSGVLVAKGDFTIALGQVQSALLPSGVSADADAMVLTLSNVGVFVGVGGALLDNNGGAATPTDYSDDTVVNGTLGFGATVGTLTLVSIKDRGALPLLATDDVTYLGVALDDFAGDLVGLESVLEFHAYGVDAVLNKVSSGVLVIPAAGKLDWSTFTSTGLDLSAAQAALNGTTLGALTSSVDLAIDGSVVLNVLSGVLVAKGDFTIALGQVQSALLPSGVSADADAMVLTLSNVGVFVGVGGALLDNNGGAATPTDYSDDTVVNGTLGFGATVGTLTLVSIKDRGALPLLATDDVTYLGVALDDFAGDLVGLESVLEFHAYGVDAVLNKVSSGVLVIPAAGKLDWSTFTSTGLDLSAAQAALNGTTLGALTSSVDLAIDGSVVLNVLSGVLVAKGDFTIALGQVQSALLPSGVSADADAMVLTLSNVGVFVGVGGALLDNNGGAATPTDYSDDTVVNGTLGFGATVGTLTLVSIKDRGALPLLATDDVTYLGVALDDFAGDLVGLESVLEFHAYGVDAVLNKVSSGVLVIPAAGKLDWSTFTSTGLDLSAAQAALNGTTLGALTSSVDLAIDGSVVLNVLSGVLVAKGDFTIALGQVQSALLPSGVSADADAMVLTLSNVGVFVGVGGALLDNNGGAATPTDYSDDTVVNGTLGFGATVGTLTLVSIKDRGALPLLATDDVTYLGVALDDFAGDLVGLESVLEFHAYGVDAVLNKVSSGVLVIPAAGKLDWSTFTSTGLDLSAAQAALNGTTLGALTSSVDLAIDGSVVLNVLSGVLVAKGDFTIALGQVQSALLPSGVSADADAMVLTLSNVGVFVGVGGALLDNNGGAATPTDYSDDTVVNGTLGFGATVGTLTLVSIKDRGALPLLATDDVTYLGVALDDFAGDLVGLESVLEFHAYGVDAVLNKVSSGVLVIPAAGKLDWSTFTSTGLDLSAAQAALNGTTLGALTSSVDLAIDGSVVLNVLSGVLVAKGDFTIALGQVQSALLPSGVSADADAMVLTLSNVGVFVGVGGALLDNNGGAATPTDYSDDTVVNGTLGFGATVGTLTLVSIKDRGALPLLATDDVTYLGVALDDFAGDLVGLESVLEFHAYGVDAVLNKVSSGVLVIPAAGKLDWSTFTSTGLDLSAAQAALNGTTLGALTATRGPGDRWRRGAECARLRGRHRGLRPDPGRRQCRNRQRRARHPGERIPHRDLAQQRRICSRASAARWMTTARRPTSATTS